VLVISSGRIMVLWYQSGYYKVEVMVETCSTQMREESGRCARCYSGVTCSTQMREESGRCARAAEYSVVAYGRVCACACVCMCVCK
jgi:hypothetical protein